MTESFYKGRTVLITGHNGFKGSYMCKLLVKMGAKAVGYSLAPAEPSLFNICNMEGITSIVGDVRDKEKLADTFKKYAPSVAIHMAAQPLVLESYKNPRETYEVNIMGTVNFLEAARRCESVKSMINVTTDKVYKNMEWAWGYREDDILDGNDPYASSKSCSELVTGAYRRAFFQDAAISTCRAGNVIGGGDFARNRIIPDCVRAIESGRDIEVRNPSSIRPYQHVLEPVYAYLLIAEKQYYDKKLAGCYNIGPKDEGCTRTDRLAKLFCEYFEGVNVINKAPDNAREAGFLKLDCSLAEVVFGFKPKWEIERAVEKTAALSKAYLNKLDVDAILNCQVDEYLVENTFP